MPSNMFDIERVRNWDKRIEPYSEKNKNRYRVARDKMNELKELAVDPNGWQVTIDSKKDRMKMEQRVSKRGYQTGRITTI